MRKAIALQYSADAPRVIATAKGELVKKMLKMAEERNITIYRDADLAEVLSSFKAGDLVPETLYRAVASVMAFCYEVNAEFRKKINESGLANG